MKDTYKKDLLKRVMKETQKRPVKETYKIDPYI